MAYREGLYARVRHQSRAIVGSGPAAEHTKKASAAWIARRARSRHGKVLKLSLYDGARCRDSCSDEHRGSRHVADQSVG